MLGWLLFMLGCVQVKEKFARELNRVIVSQQTRQEYRLKHQTFSCDMHVCIEPPSSIQNSNDIAYTWHGSLYTWHGSTDLYQIGKTIVVCAKRFCLIQKGCNSAQTVNAEIASNKSRIDSMSYRLLRKGGIPIAPRDSINDQGNTTLLKRFLVRMKYLA
jgi:hypothetical protein